ncbi:MAG: HlyD family efflux transporter periplasmic adaptor subunit [Burkholderiales bacterium]|nr:HlyD family efflux transporter periplasmic adaptor subunit [Burkholderiales bacterium]
MSQNDKVGATPTNGRRARVLTLLIGLFLAAGIGYAVYWTLVGRYVESTDDAYVGGNLVQITPQVSGTVLAIAADDTDYVTAGETLVQLDQADARIALDQAEAALARSVRQVRNLMATTAQIEASVALRETELQRARADLARRAPLASSGALPAEELQHARDALASSRAALDVAERQLAAQKTLVDHTTVETHPEVQSAAARVREAYLAYARTVVPAPVSGIVAKRSVQVGQRVAPGAPLMAVIPLDQVWVDANFKERQLLNLRPGQAVKLRADIYGSAVEFHGRLVGFGAGTGSAFALLPPQNATGNWIKVVQRVPVRIALDPAEVARHPLRIGLSMQVEVDTHKRDGELRPASARTAPAYQSMPYDSLGELANQRVAAVIKANGGASRAARRPEKETTAAAQPKSGTH